MHQVGKTWILKEFGKGYYENTAYFNFEENDLYKQFFETTKDVNRVLQNLMFASGQKITPEKTLIIFDGVQCCPKAIQSLKYFCENAPEYHIACAETLHGIVATKQFTFPVGKVNFMTRDPMTFTEFLLNHYLIKVFTRQDRPEGYKNHGLKQETSGLHIGYDTFISQNEKDAWLVGATVRYAHAVQKGLSTVNGGDGDLNSYSAKVYATWIHDSEAYADALAQIGYYDQKVEGISNDGLERFTGDYGSWGYGTSIELGRMFTLTDSKEGLWRNHFFIEPQIELSYFMIEGQKFAFSTGMQVDQEDADFLTGRLGVVIGKKWNYDTDVLNDRRYFQIGFISSITKEFLGEQSLLFTGVDGEQMRVDGKGLGGRTMSYGLTFDWQYADQWRLYGEIDCAHGESYTKDYGVNLGLKYTFN